MNLFEYEGKQLLRKFDILTPNGYLITDPESAPPMDYPFVLKAQVMTGGRGKAGGVRACENEEEYIKNRDDIINMEIKDHKVHGLLAEEMVSVERELYISITLQGVKRPTLIASRKGGMDIEAVSVESPEEIIKIEIDPFTKLKNYQIKFLTKRLEAENIDNFATVVKNIERAFFECGANLVEINPMGVVNGNLIAMDSKFALDIHNKKANKVIEEIKVARRSLYRYKNPVLEKTTITYVPLEGDLGLISDGAGTGMLTLDLINNVGGRLASFCELGGMTTEEVMYRALQLTLDDHPNVKGVIIVLIGGFNRMDNMANGITSYVKENNINIPIYTRMCGTKEEIGLEIMRSAGMPTYNDLTDAVVQFVNDVEGRRNGNIDK